MNYLPLIVAQPFTGFRDLMIPYTPSPHTIRVSDLGDSSDLNFRNKIFIL